MHHEKPSLKHLNMYNNLGSVYVKLVPSLNIVIPKTTTEKTKAKTIQVSSMIVAVFCGYMYVIGRGLWVGICIIVRNKTYVPVFYRGNKIWVRVRVRMN